MTALATAPTKEAGNELATRPGRDQTARKARQCSIIPLSRGRSELAARFWPWACRVARKHAERYEWCHGLDWEEAAAVGLCDAAERFSPAWGVRFKSYARHRIQYAVVDLVRDEMPRGYRRSGAKAPRIESLYRPLPLITANHLCGEVVHGREGQLHGLVTLSHLIASPTRPVDWKIEAGEAAEDFEEVVRCLPATHRKVCRLFYCKEWTQKQISQLLGCSESRVSQLRTEALAWLREARAA